MDTAEDPAGKGLKSPEEENEAETKTLEELVKMFEDSLGEGKIEEAMKIAWRIEALMQQKISAKMMERTSKLEDDAAVKYIGADEGGEPAPKKPRLAKMGISIAAFKPLAATAKPEVTTFKPLAATAEEEGKKCATVFPVWYGTNRQPKSTDPATNEVKAFTAECSKSLTLGKVDVCILKYHDIPGKPEPGFWAKLRRLDFRKDISVQKITKSKSKEDFLEEVGKQISGNDSLVFIHGYNVDFESAAERAGQLGYDLKIPGATVLFSWPSAGKTFSYTVDESTIAASECYLAEFLKELSGCNEKGKIHILAHSMGNRGLLRALQRIRIATDNTVQFGNIIFAAPDEDSELFTEVAKTYFSEQPTSLAKSFTLYSSSRDLAVLASRKLHHYPRAGLWKPYTIAAMVNSIVASVSEDFLGHSYFAEAGPVLKDIISMMNGEEPDSRAGLEMVDGYDTVWSLKKVIKAKSEEAAHV